MNSFSKVIIFTVLQVFEFKKFQKIKQSSICVQWISITL